MMSFDFYFRQEMIGSKTVSGVHCRSETSVKMALCNEAPCYDPMVEDVTHILSVIRHEQVYSCSFGALCPVPVCVFFFDQTCILSHSVQFCCDSGRYVESVQYT